ncbi:hypothetical protein CONCODRAFT_77677 [Conidiobolus coronatus NRRL 28638]|uniref:G-protein coupled receptors family 1 profile domain-containing protein n=1 Tax=Conidiobolus coronatus (strain ATCC 28846 / CBS 209.66 / NRRL 28638) TaxID=796925 RepID=A0A137PCB0_CONC2|nr:hypothetical protein CONCODRAFT_77677 [Conidiobolus coronatus NRRL 28638]|eukprot:KXN72639.1 hypothetical protein CONCODRAFT_77677 [Conidiobolus coronatus NRRL 28638]
MESPQGHCLWISNIRNCTESAYLVTMVKVQVAITTLGWILAIITLIIHTRANKNKFRLMKSTEIGFVPNPIPSILVFWGLSSFVRMWDEIILINNWLPYYSYRKLLQAVGFWLLSVGSTWYLMGIIFNIPKNFTTVYYKALRNNGEPKPVVLIWVPTNMSSKLILYVCSLAMLVINLPLSYLSGSFFDQKDWDKGIAILAIEHLVGAMLLFAAFIKSSYYGRKLYKIVKLHDRTLLASKKVKSAFSNMRNTFIFFAGFNSIVTPAWLLLPLIYKRADNMSTALYLVLGTYFRIGVSVLNILIIGNILVGLILNVRSSEIVSSDDNHKLVPLSASSTSNQQYPKANMNTRQF